MSLLSFLSFSSSSSRELSDWNSLSLSKESFSDNFSAFFISASFFSLSTYSLSCLKIAKAFWAFCESTGSSSFLTISDCFGTDSSSYMRILDSSGESLVERLGNLVWSSMIARSDSFGNTLQMPSWSIEGGLLCSDSFNSSRTEFYYLFDLNGLITSY